MGDTFDTIRFRTRAELKVRGSRFIGTAIPVRTREGANDAIEGVRRQFHDATHNCFAYRLGVGGEERRFNDDGEPSGSAGRPILGALERAAVTNLVVIVTRYFGGTKLGVGGLARAYGEATARVIQEAERETRYIVRMVSLAIPHAYIGEVMRAVSRMGAKICDTTYDEEVHLELQVRRSKVRQLRAGLIECTAGNIRFTQSNEDPD